MNLLTISNLISWSAQVAAIVAAALLALKLTRLDAPAVRYVFLRIVLAVCLLLPFVQPYAVAPSGSGTTSSGVLRGPAAPSGTAGAFRGFAADRWSRGAVRAFAAMACHARRSADRGRRREAALDRRGRDSPAPTAARRRSCVRQRCVRRPAAHHRSVSDHPLCRGARPACHVRLPSSRSAAARVDEGGARVYPACRAGPRTMACAPPRLDMDGRRRGAARGVLVPSRRVDPPVEDSEDA